MKKIFALIVWLPAASAASNMPLPLPDVKIEAQPVSLIEDALRRAPDFVSDFQRQNQAPARAQRQVSRMPVIPPPCEADSKMVREPDQAVDYKLIVKTPDMGTQR